VQQHPVLDVPTHGPGERDALDIPSDPGEFGDTVSVVDARDLLLDDRPLVELLGHVMGRRTDQLHAARMRLRVRTCRSFRQ